ncbi:MAG: 50S ribosomal protein L23, partial [Mycoplasmoidaceae bacterium]|nr:50S ribosomal protein L23 [Mycoplasmoidaceae bacterium]
TKYDIKLAFESIYGFAPEKVSTQIRKPAKIRTGTAIPGFTKKIKIAYVTLPTGKSIASEESTEAKDVAKESKVEAKETSSGLKEIKKDEPKKEAKASKESK